MKHLPFHFCYLLQLSPNTQILISRLDKFYPNIKT